MHPSTILSQAERASSSKGSLSLGEETGNTLIMEQKEGLDLGQLGLTPTPPSSRQSNRSEVRLSLLAAAP